MAERAPGIVRSVIIGTGLIGGMLAGHLGGAGEAVAFSARRVIAGGEDERLRAALDGADAVIFAHGRSVRWLRRHLDAILASRLDPLPIVAEAMAGTGNRCPVVLVSSTVACLPERPGGPPDLGSIQRAFERRFAECFANRPRQVLRVGLLTGPGSQIEGEVARMRRSLLMKRLRLSTATDIPHADAGLLCAAVDKALAGERAGTSVVAHARGLDLNELLDQVLCVGSTIAVPKRLYQRIVALFGVPPGLLDVDMAAVRRPG